MVIIYHQTFWVIMIQRNSLCLQPKFSQIRQCCLRELDHAFASDGFMAKENTERWTNLKDLLPPTHQMWNQTDADRLITKLSHVQVLWSIIFNIISSWTLTGDYHLIRLECKVINGLLKWNKTVGTVQEFFPIWRQWPMMPEDIAKLLESSTW